MAWIRIELYSCTRGPCEARIEFNNDGILREVILECSKHPGGKDTETIEINYEIDLLELGPDSYSLDHTVAYINYTKNTETRKRIIEFYSGDKLNTILDNVFRLLRRECFPS